MRAAFNGLFSPCGF
uniref:Uncharacterized protein n=1 Tax=Anguilla anguilla TaxID=7936 RepID=A0A0E9T7C3_ANGAN